MDNDDDDDDNNNNNNNNNNEVRLESMPNQNKVTELQTKKEEKDESSLSNGNYLARSDFSTYDYNNDDSNEYDNLYDNQNEIDGLINHRSDQSVSEEPAEAPILHASEKGKLNLVKQMIQQDPCSVNVSDVDGYTPLHRACYNNRIEVVKYLIENGANLSAQTIDGWQPIHSAAQWGHVNVVRILVSSGADINARTNGRNTPFHLAVSRPSNRPLIEYMLFSDDVDIEAKNDASDTAFDICKRNSLLYKLWDLL